MNACDELHVDRVTATLAMERAPHSARLPWTTHCGTKSKRLIGIHF